jgi:hypothetical protein
VVLFIFIFILCCAKELGFLLLDSSGVRLCLLSSLVLCCVVMDGMDGDIHELTAQFKSRLLADYYFLVQVLTSVLI